MKKQFLFAALAAMTLASAALTGCDDEPNTPKTLERVTVSPKTVTIAVGETVTLDLTEQWSAEGNSYGGYGYGDHAGWKSSDETVATATIIEGGVYNYLYGMKCEVTGVAVGKTTITYSSYAMDPKDVKTDTCEVTVVEKKE
jgi:uncharacterized protein YjdB